MAHFAFIAPPLRGHYAPLSNLAAELLTRGHRATFVHQEEARPLVDADGAEFEPIGAREPPVERWTRPMARIRGIVGLGGVMKRMERFTSTFCREGPAVLRRIGVDAIIADQLEPAGGLLSEHMGIPWISVADTVPMNREPGIPPPFVNWQYDPSARGLRRNAAGWLVSDIILRSFNRAIEQSAADLGLPTRSRIEDCFSPLLQLAQVVPGLDFPRHELPSTFHYTGPFRRHGGAPFDLPPSDGKLVVFCSLGTLQGSRARIFRRVAHACSRLGLRLVLTHGGQAKHFEVEGLPGDSLVYSWLPQERVLSQVDLVVCHGGMNTALDSLAAGLPMVVMPLAFEQGGIAARVQHSGSGLMLSARTGGETLQHAIALIRDESSFRSRAGALRDEIRRSGGVARAADLIEHALGVSAPRAAPTMARAARDGARSGSRSGNR